MYSIYRYEIIEIQIAETIGAGEDLVQFGPGHSIVTLHFKREDKDETIKPCQLFDEEREKEVFYL